MSDSDSLTLKKFAVFVEIRSVHEVTGNCYGEYLNFSRVFVLTKVMSAPWGEILVYAVFAHWCLI